MKKGYLIAVNQSQDHKVLDQTEMSLRYACPLRYSGLIDTIGTKD